MTLEAMFLCVLGGMLLACIVLGPSISALERRVADLEKEARGRAWEKQWEERSRENPRLDPSQRQRYEEYQRALGERPQ